MPAEKKYSTLKELKTDNFGETVMELKKMTIETFKGSKECKFVEVTIRMITDTKDIAQYNLQAHDYDPKEWFDKKGDS